MAFTEPGNSSQNQELDKWWGAGHGLVVSPNKGNFARGLMALAPEVVNRLKLCTVAVGLDLGPKIHPKIVGTGFMVSAMGHCFTNAHVAQALLTPLEYWHTLQLSPRACVIAYEFIPGKGMATIKAGIKSVLYASWREEKTEGVQYGGVPDVAVISTDLSESPCLDIADEILPSEGTEVYFCGFPLGEEMFFEEHGLEQVTSLLQRGIISAHMPFSGIPNPHAFKIDATCNPGNSGSPVVREDGKAIGVVYARRTEAFTYAVPIRDFRPMIDRAIELEASGAKDHQGQMRIVAGQQYRPPQQLQSDIVEEQRQREKDHQDPSSPTSLAQ